jgi:hypothetical protein
LILTVDWLRFVTVTVWGALGCLNGVVGNCSSDGDTARTLLGADCTNPLYGMPYVNAVVEDDGVSGICRVPP